MVTYTAHERNSDLTDIAARAEGIVFVKEGFAWAALVFPFLWLIYHRMWVVLTGFFAIVVAIETGIFALGLADEVAVMTTIALSGIFALQANDLRRWSLARRGYQLVELMSGRDLGECEERFFTWWLASQGAQAGTMPKAAMQVPASTAKSSAAANDIIGLFPEPGK